MKQEPTNLRPVPCGTGLRPVPVNGTGLRTIPGVGKSIEQDLIELGYTSVADLKGADPEAMYNRFCTMKGQQIDRCLLYVFRCAVYFAGHKTHDPKKLKWWYWKD